MRRVLLGVVLIGALFVTAGCVDIVVNSSVAADGTVESYNVEITANNSIFGTMESQARAAGYDSFGAFFLAENVSADRSNAESVNINQERGPQNTTVTIEMQNYDPGPDSNISVSVQDGTVTYEDVTFGTQSDATPTPTPAGGGMDLGGSGGSIEYTLEMPGQVQTASQGGTIDGNTVSWEIEGDGNLYIYAESTVPDQGSGSSGGDGSGGSGGDGGGSSGFGPGFGVVGVVVALAIVALVARRRAGN